MATVYEAHDLRLNRGCAVKVMHTDLGDDHDFAARFVREAHSAARLSHPNVVSVTDQGDDDGRLFLVMEHVPGRTLRDVIREEAPMPPSRALAPARAGAAGARRGAPLRARAPRHQAGERAHRRRRPGQGRRLRAGPRLRRQHHPHRHRRPADRHGLLPGARAHRERQGRPPLRRVRRRGAALRDAHRPQAARGRGRDPDRLQARQRGRPAALGGDRPADPGVRRRAGPAGHRPRARAPPGRRQGLPPAAAPGPRRAVDAGEADDAELTADLLPAVPAVGATGIDYTDETLAEMPASRPPSRPTGSRRP